MACATFDLLEQKKHCLLIASANSMLKSSEVSYTSELVDYQIQLFNIMLTDK
jgi:hypothetical protein